MPAHTFGNAHASKRGGYRTIRRDGAERDNGKRKRKKKGKKETNETARNITGEDSAGTNETMMLAMLDEKNDGYYPCTGLDEGWCAPAHHQYASTLV